MRRLVFLWHRLRGHHIVRWGYRLHGGRWNDNWYCGHCRREIGR